MPTTRSATPPRAGQILTGPLFDEPMRVETGGDLRAQFGVNQWMRQPRAVTSLDLAKRDDVLPGLRQAHWDLVIVDEAHRMSARDESHKSQRYKLGELLRDASDHLLLLTATPHKGDPDNFSLERGLAQAEDLARAAPPDVPGPDELDEMEDHDREPIWNSAR